MKQNANVFQTIDRMSITQDAIQVYCSRSTADNLLEICEQCALFALQLGKQCFRIFYSTSQDPFEIPASFAILAKEEEAHFSALKKLQEITSFDLQEFYNRAEPSYLIAVPSQKLLACNQAGLRVNQKTAQEYIGQSVIGLWDDEKLMKLMGYLENAPNNLIGQYEFIGRRWRRDTMQGEVLWRRDDYAFLSRYQLVNFMGQKCRYGVTLQAQKVVSSVE